MIKNTPKLRFNEYSDNWIECPLSDLANLARGKFSVRPRNDPRYFGGNIPFIQTSDIVKSSIYVEQYSQTLNELGLKVSKVFPVRTIMITIAANIGDVAILKSPMACPDSLVGIEAKEFVANNIWLMYSLLLKKDELESLATQNAQKNINLQILNSLNIFIPAYQEQKKMARFLLSVDKKISLQIRKIELLQQYKKGMIRNLFSQKIQFKDNDGYSFPNWTMTSFGEAYSFLTTNSLSRACLTDDCGNMKNIHYGDIHTKYPALLDSNIQRIPYIKEGIDTSKFEISKKGDLIIADASEDYNDIGKSVEIIATDEKSPLVAGLHTFLARPTIDFASGFSGYLMQTEHIRRQIKVLATGISVLGISKSNLAKVTFFIPCIEEQQKIADFLSSIDDKITIENNKLDKLKQWKQGLLQQMFV